MQKSKQKERKPVEPVEEIYVAGHQNSDMDSTACSFAGAELFEARPKLLGLRPGQCMFTPVRHGILGPEARYVYQFAGLHMDAVKTVVDLGGKRNVRVDHTWANRIPGGGETIGFLDHHAFDGVMTDLRPMARLFGYASCSTLIYRMFKENRVRISRIVGILLLAGLLVDSVVLTSNMTETDFEVAYELGRMLHLDPVEFGNTIFRESERILMTFNDSDLLQYDFKQFDEGGLSYAVSAINVPDIRPILDRQNLRSTLAALRKEKQCPVGMILLFPVEGTGCDIIIDVEQELFTEGQVIDALQTVLGKGVQILESDHAVVDGLRSRKVLKQSLATISRTLK